MKKIKNKIFLNTLGLVSILLLSISCSDADQKKVQKETTNTLQKIEMTKTPVNPVSKTTCTDCHNVDDKGDLKFRDKDGKFELRKKPNS